MVDATGESELGFSGGLRLGWTPGSQSGSLLLLGARVYHAGLRRWVQADTVEATRYTYAAGDPVNLIDPRGRVPLDPGVVGRISPSLENPAQPQVQETPNDATVCDFGQGICWFPPLVVPLSRSNPVGDRRGDTTVPIAWNGFGSAGTAPGIGRGANIHERIARFVGLVWSKTTWNFKTTWRATGSPFAYLYRSVVKGEEISMWETVMGIGAYEGFVATTTGILATTTTWESTSGLITYYVVDNAGLAVDWVALGGGVAVSVAVSSAGTAAAAFVGVGVGSFLEALAEATYDAFTWNGHVYE